ncbi:uncharacterized protein LOC114322923 [Camellia sinensis]|uniref:uncharacterized protein LOC114322923 n=1 Tax=Camellia sinensis TaxID=4442 RepID=UPI001036E6CE|nr:uncharacterized protein LOC114322923 [Camellia sinensis]
MEECRCIEFEKRLRTKILFKVARNMIQNYDCLVEAATHVEIIEQVEEERIRGSTSRGHKSQGDYRPNKKINLLNLPSIFPLAFAIVDSETTANWTWFLQQLTKVVSSARTLTFVSNCNIGLLAFLPAVFPSAHHAYYLQHLQANLRDKLRWVDNRGQTIWGDDLELCRIVNKLILDVRNYPITSLVDTIRNQIMTMRVERKVLATNWNGLLCPKMKSRVREAYSNGCTWIVSQSNEDIYEVYSFPTVLSSGRDFNTFVEKIFIVDQYRVAYSGYIQPIPIVDKPSFSEDDFIIYPPAVKRPPGRPKKN